MRHSETFKRRRAKLKKDEVAVKGEIDTKSGNYFRVIFLAIAGGIILLIINRLLRGQRKGQSKAIPKRTKNQTWKWLGKRLLEVGAYYVIPALTTKLKNLKR